MRKLLVRRVWILVPTLFGAVLACFLIAHYVPGDPLAAVLGDRAMENPEIVAAYRAKWGLDRSLPEQFGIYVWNLVRGDLGISIRTQRPVVEDLAEYLPATLELALGSLALAIGGGILLGVLAAVKCNSWVDQVLRVIAMTGSSMPVFWMALIFLQVFYAGLGWSPGPGRLDTFLSPPPSRTGLYVVDALLARNVPVALNALRHLLLPSIVLGWRQLGLIARITRASMLEVLSADYVRTARAKGLAERVAVFRHALPNAMLPTVTVIGLAVAGVMAGAVQTEVIFAWPGVGRYAVESSEALDFTGIMGVTLLISGLYALSNVAVDLLYGVLDPRIRE
jgi:peptide/nickel transport system permease protein